MYLVIKSTVASSGRINAGDVVELSEDEASALLAMGRVVAAHEKPKSMPTQVDRSVGLNTSDAPTLSKREKAKRNADILS
jgi:hypothetical protein